MLTSADARAKALRALTQMGFRESEAKVSRIRETSANTLDSLDSLDSLTREALRGLVRTAR